MLETGIGKSAALRESTRAQHWNRHEQTQTGTLINLEQTQNERNTRKSKQRKTWSRISGKVSETHTTRSANMKNSNSTYKTSNTASTPTCRTKNKPRERHAETTFKLQEAGTKTIPDQF
jgi:hypothetical protein